MPAVETVGAITQLCNKLIDLWAGFMKTKKVRYSIEGNKVAYEYMKRVDELYNPDDKKLKKLKERFLHLAIVQ